MTDLRKAAEKALEYLENTSPETDALVPVKPHIWEHRGSLVIQALRQALAQQDSDCERCKGVGCVACDSRQILAQSEQEPVAWVTFNAYGEEDDVWYENPEGKLLDGWTYKPLYTAPPKREWKGLTSDDKHFLLANAWNKEQAFDGLMDAIDKFLEEKNT